jgi:DNA-directed RNA polymerase sigma subunit (sigma70/sigma32)
MAPDGCVGLLEAVDHYEPTRGPALESYARFRVRRAIRNALTDQARLVRVPEQIGERRRALDQVEARFVAAGTRPSPSHLAARSVQVARA